ncbi:photosystem II core complex proteins psbY [Zea mays]|jgi:photosystem II PsbY protein|uniref:Photosystem II core complex protein psbY n=2 Tax=Zea mays TaxID=4577 RepID=B6SQV2_MAIZE|nr:photosystem II core complex proteins psbY [Zea mays]ACG27235.1 photosystem II core complex proteins psbY [Zea mays]AQK78407.1 Photosystem II core complex protein psbY [Zea mays]|eukprot:NP_001147385.1 photosystem II core complex proteins psbY [Zea mays]
MATIATMALLKPAAKAAARSAPSTSSGSVSLRVRTGQAAKKAALSVSASSTLAGAFLAALASSPDAALADVAAADAGGDSRGQLLLVVVAPAIGWVLYNILQPALNQLNRMRSSQAVAAGLGLGAAAAAGMAAPPEASAAVVQDLAAIAAAAPADDSRGLLLLIVVAPAIGWVLFNILQPALNQLNRMRSD